MGKKLGMSLEEWTEFSAEIQQLNETVDGLKGNMFGPTEQERGRLGIRISQENPDWTEAEVMAEADRILEEKWMTSDAYREAALAETALFEKYGITKPNPSVYGTGIWQDEDGKYYRFESNQGHLWQTTQDTSFLDVAVPLGIGLGASLITGGAMGSMFTGSGLLAGSGLGATMQGALQGVVGSAFGQGVTGQGIDPQKLLQAAMLGGLGGMMDSLQNMDGAIMDNAILGGADSMVSKVSDMLNIGYDQALDLVGGLAEGAISGGDLESMVAGVVGNLAPGKIEDYLTEAFGETVNVDDWFKDGQSHIPMEAFTPIIKGAVEAAIEGGMDAEDAIKMAWGYFDNGGDIDFMLPGFMDFLEEIPGLDFEKGEWSFGYDEESGDLVIGHNLPSWDFDFNLPEGSDLQIGNPCTTPEGQEGTIIGGALHGQWICDPTLPSINIGDPCRDEEGNQGILNKLGLCDISLPEIGTPCSTEEGQGIWALTNLDEMVCEIEIKIDTPYNCEEKGAGWTWDNLVEECIPPLSVEPTGCGEGETWSEVLGRCVPDIIECVEGFEWDGQTCVEIPDIVECLPGFDWDGQTCVQVDFEIPEWELPELPDLPDLPELPEAPEVTAQATTTKPFKTTRTEQFDYTPFNVYKPAAREDLSGITLPSPGKGLFK